MESSSSCWMTKMSSILLILERKSVHYKHSAQLSIVKKEVNIKFAQGLFESKQMMGSVKKSTTLLKNKLPGGPSPGSGNALINNDGIKSGWRAESIMKNKLPSGGSPGTGNSYINDGGIKIGVKNTTLLKNKLPSGGSPGSGNAYINDGGA
ncbi:hypothetical protein SUGI_0943960 [Cryptomeria japonica]|nr:hypothetical protein SUGI_0943960 [Cryptomeria japonica]